MIPAMQITINTVKSFGFIALLNMIMLGRLKVVTAIKKLRTTPRSAPFARRLSAMGMQPKISAYIGTPQTVARITPKGFL